jgi:hypothetical protein
MQLNVVCSVRTLFESSFGLISDKIYISVFDEVFMRTCCVYDINYYEFFEGELDRERALVFLIIAVQIFEAIIEKAELVSYKVNGMHVARVVLRQIIKFCDEAEIDLFTQDETIIIGENNKFVNIVIGPNLYETYIVIGILS